MRLYYSPSKGGFYSDDVHTKEQIPSDALVITEEKHKNLLNGQTNGQLITSDSSGNPENTDHPPETIEAQENAARDKRDSLIAKTDYLLMSDYPITYENLELIKKYRQGLRDITFQSGFPTKIDWPEYPL